MREIESESIVQAVADLCIKANTELSGPVEQALQEARQREEAPVGREILAQLLENAAIARREKLPICQDTGLAVVYVRLGQEVHIRGCLEEAIHRGVARGYTEGYLRKSVVGDPLQRVNTGDNTPAIIHYEVIPGEELTLTVAPKGIGSENMSRLYMLKPSQGLEGIEEAVLETVRLAGSNACPPLVIGLGVGGNFERAAELAKKALLRPVGVHSEDPFWAEIEANLLEKVNRLGIGPQGMGGRVTALWLAAETYPTHIGGLPVAVNLNCHVARHESISL